MRKSVSMSNLEAIRSIGQGYHERDNYDSNYAFQGYVENGYFTSDRVIKLDANFRPLKKDGTLDEKRILKGYGLEIETECWSINDDEALSQVISKICTSELNSKLFKYQHDGSLCSGNSSIECITQVMTKEFVRNNYPGFKRMFEWFKKFGISASQSGNCGMHVNMSNGLFGTNKKDQAVAIKKLIYIVNKHYDFICDLVKRSRSRTGYCSRMNDFTRIEYAKSFDLERYGREERSCHGIAFNYAHFESGRVELRLVGGQKDYFEFRNTMECIFHLVDAVKNISWEQCDDLKRIFKGCNKYVVKRLTDCVSSNSLSRSDFEEIKANSDTETDFGNF